MTGVGCMKKIMESISDGALLVDKEGKVEFVNRAFLDISDFKAQELLGSNLSVLAEKHPSESLFKQLLTNLERPDGYKFSVESHALDFQLNVQTFREPGGTWFLVEWHCHQLPADCERKKQFENIVTQYEAVIDSMPYLYAYVDTEFNFVRVNKNYADSDGRSPDAFIGENLLDFYPLDEVREIFQKVVATKEPVFLEDWQFAYPDRPDEVQYFDWMLTPVFDQSGELLGLNILAENVTEKFHLKNAAQESSDRFELIFNTVPIGIVKVGTDLKIIDANEHYCQLSNCLKEELVGLPLHETVFPDDRALVEAAIASGSDHPVGKKVERRLVRKDRNPLWVRSFGSWARDREGQILYGLGVVEDISEVRALESIQEQYEAVYKSAAYGIGYSDLDGNLLNHNQALCDILGYSEDELMSLHFLDLTPPEYNDMEAEMIGHVMGTGQSVYYEKELIRKSGRRIPVSLSVFKVTDKNAKDIGLGAVIRDISQEKKTRDQVAESEEMFRLFLESTAEAVYGTDMEGYVTFINPSGLETLGYEKQEELLGKKIHDIIHYKSLDGTPITEVDCPVHRARSQGMPISADDVFWRKDGTSFPVEYLSSPIRKKNQTVGTVVFFVDITDRKKQRQQLLDALEQKEILLKEVHHRVKNNLQVIAGMVQLQLVSDDSGLLAESLGEMVNRIHTMAILHESIYKTDDFANIPAAKYIEELLVNLQESYFHNVSNVKIVQDLEPVTLTIDQLLPVGLIVNELVTNALKYAFGPEQKGTIEVVLKLQAENILVRIIDNGQGFPPDLDVDTRASLGLRMVNTLTRQLSGKINYLNNNGAEIEISFPMQMRT